MEHKVFLFPLNNAVTLRKIALPFHIFEPRYRQMVHDAVAQNTPISVVHWNKEDFYTGDVCVGGVPQILHTHSDGRMDIMIPGDVKFRLLRPLQVQPYPIFNCNPLVENMQSRKDWQMEVESLQAMLTQWAHRMIQQEDQRAGFFRVLQDKEALLSYSCLFLVNDIQSKKEVIKASSFDEKMELLMKFLGPAEIPLGPFLPSLKR